MALYEASVDLYDIAAAYADHVAQNQALLDGNKRAGLGAAAAFLFMNGIDLRNLEEGGESVLATAMLDLATGRWPESRRTLAAVLRARSV